MKKRIVSLLLAIMILASVLPIQVFAASYPTIFIDPLESSRTIPTGSTGKFYFTIFHEYKNERYQMRVYDPNGNLIATASDSMYNSSAYFTELTMRASTSGWKTGTYKLVYWMEFYTLGEWKTAPNKYTHKFKVVSNKCAGNHKYEVSYVYEEPTCTQEGRADKKCKNCGHILYTTLPKEHNYDKGVITLNPTPTTDGVMTYTCQTCSGTKTKVISSSKAVHITTQPKNANAPENEKATVTVKATGDGLEYNWYYQKPGESEWIYTDSSTTNTYKLTMTPERSGRKIKCVIKDKYGNEATTKEVTVVMQTPLKIISQPKSAAAYIGEYVTTTVNVQGDGLTYKWYYKSPGSSSFKYTDSSKTATYKMKMTEERDGRQVKCVIKDEYGHTITSKTVTLKVRTPLEITKQPKSTTVPEGEYAKVTVKVQGDGLKYNWYYQLPGSEEWIYTDSSTSSTYKLKMSESRSGRKIKCVITDTYGEEVTSKVVTVAMQTPLKITSQPVNAIVNEGEYAMATVKAQGDGLTYKWYYKSPGSSSFKYTDSSTSDTYKMKMTEARSGRQVKCVITDAYGNSVTSKTVKLKLPTPLKITTQPKSTTVASGEYAKVTVKVQGDGLKYNWYYQKPGNTEWIYTDSSTSSTYKLKMSESRSGRKIKCIITDAYGEEVTTKTVTVKMK